MKKLHDSDDDFQLPDLGYTPTSSLKDIKPVFKPPPQANKAATKKTFFTIPPNKYLFKENLPESSSKTNADVTKAGKCKKSSGKFSARTKKKPESGVCGQREQSGVQDSIAGSHDICRGRQASRGRNLGKDFTDEVQDLSRRKLAGYVASQDTTEERYESIFDVAANRFSRAKPLAMEVTGEGGVDNGRKIMRGNPWDRRGEESGQEARRIKQQVVAGQAISSRSTEKVQNRFNSNNFSSAPNRQADQRQDSFSKFSGSLSRGQSGLVPSKGSSHFSGTPSSQPLQVTDDKLKCVARKRKAKTAAERIIKKTKTSEEEEGLSDYDNSTSDPDFKCGGDSSPSSQTLTNGDDAQYLLKVLDKSRPKIIAKPSRKFKAYLGTAGEASARRAVEEASAGEEPARTASGEAPVPVPEKTGPDIDDAGVNVKNVCKKCFKVYSNLKSFVKHSSRCGQTIVKCKICHVKFKSTKSLKRHNKKKHNRAPQFECDKCEMKFRTEAKLISHTKIHTSAKCNDCFKSFPTRGALKVHRFRLHGNKVPSEAKKVAKKVWSCPVCQHTTSSDRGMRYHVQLHSTVEEAHDSGESKDESQSGPEGNDPVDAEEVFLASIGEQGELLGSGVILQGPVGDEIVI